MTSETSDSTGPPVIPNPYASPFAATVVEEPVARRIRVVPVISPGGPSDCPYFTFDEFAEVLTAKMVEACKPWGIDAYVAGTASGEAVFESTIRCCVHEILPYQIPFWQKVLKYTPLPIGYSYFPARFCISGTIESRHHPTIGFSRCRKVSQRRFSEKANMLLAMQAEAVRIVSKASRALDKSDTTVGRRPFWLFVATVPFAAATFAALVTYHQWALVCQLLPTIGGQQPAINPRADALVHAGLIFFLIAPLVLAGAPRWVYEDRRARFVYSFVNTTRSAVLRAFFAALALPATILLGLSLLP